MTDITIEPLRKAVQTVDPAALDKGDVLAMLDLLQAYYEVAAIK
jgi:hypothetical protein